MAVNRDVTRNLQCVNRHSLMLALLNGGKATGAAYTVQESRHSLMLALLNGGSILARRAAAPTPALSDVSVTEWRIFAHFGNNVISFRHSLMLALLNGGGDVFTGMRRCSCAGTL